MSSSRQPREGNCIVPILQMEKLKLPETKDIPESHRSRWQSWIGPGSLTLGRSWGSLATARPWPALGIIMALEGHHRPGLLEGRGHLLHLRVSQSSFRPCIQSGLNARGWRGRISEKAERKAGGFDFELQYEGVRGVTGTEAVSLFSGSHPQKGRSLPQPWEGSQLPPPPAERAGMGAGGGRWGSGWEPGGELGWGPGAQHGGQGAGAHEFGPTPRARNEHPNWGDSPLPSDQQEIETEASVFKFFFLTTNRVTRFWWSLEFPSPGVSASHFQSPFQRAIGSREIARHGRSGECPQGLGPVWVC